MSLFPRLGRSKSAPEYPADRLTTRDGHALTITFFRHASLAIDFDGRRIYVDPVGEYAPYDRLPKADLILVTHSHYDHFDRTAVEQLEKILAPGSDERPTQLLCDRTSAEAFDFACTVMQPGLRAEPLPGITVEAVAAYNTSEGHTGFHPREREDCGYVLTLGGTRIYIAGDTEPTPEMEALHAIDIAFLPVNQPYTMTVGQAVGAVRALRPAIFYPYHYGEVEERTDTDRLLRELSGDPVEVRLRPME